MRMRLVLIFCFFTIASAVFGLSDGAGAAPLERQDGYLLAQADGPARVVPQPGTGRPREAPLKTGPAVIPEPPPFPEQDDDAGMIWALVVGAGMIVIVIVLIVMMVRRDTRKKPRKPVAARAPAARRDPFSSMDEKPATPPRAEPLTVIQTQWKDIQTNSGSLSTIGLEVVQADEMLRESIKKGGYNPFFGPTSGGIDSGIEVIEMSNGLPDIEALGAMGLHDQAIERLEHLMIENEHPEPKVWLMLFDLYIRTGMQEKYSHLARGFKAYFNADVPAWNELGTSASKYLEDYPAVINKVVRLWQQPTCGVYLDSLLYDNRNGTRTGFSLPAYGDLVFLTDIIKCLKEMDANPDRPGDPDLGLTLA